MEMEPIPGFQLTSWDKGYQDFLMSPDASTARELAWSPGSALLICDLIDAAGHPIEDAPRRILARQVERAARKGLAFKMASELEFYLFRESYESAQKKGYRGLEHFGAYIEDYHILQGAKEEFVNAEIRNLMEASGIPVETSKGEWGPGQHEINLGYAAPMAMADRHTLYKHGAKEIAMQKGVCLTFMAKPDAKLAGSSCHIHASLWDRAQRRNLFSEGGKGENHGPAFRHFLGGLMALSRDLALFLAPSVNSYKRYQSATFAPTRIAWGKDNRTCGFRVVGEGASLRIENRIPGADVNAYLAFAATIGAGLYGLEHKIEPPAIFEGNAYQSNAPSVPKSLPEAVEALSKSKVAREIFGEEVVAHYLRAARAEQAAFERAVTCWERERYFERI
jgi:glutamine synthetase